MLSYEGIYLFTSHKTRFGYVSIQLVGQSFIFLVRKEINRETVLHSNNRLKTQRNTESYYISMKLLHQVSVTLYKGYIYMSWFTEVIFVQHPADPYCDSGLSLITHKGTDCSTLQPHSGQMHYCKIRKENAPTWLQQGPNFIKL